MNTSLRLRAITHLLPALLSVCLPVVRSHAQANFAGTETAVTSIANLRVSGFAVDPWGSVYICDGEDNQLDKAARTQGGYGALTPILSGVCPDSQPPAALAVDVLGNVFYASGTQVMEAPKNASGFGTPIVVAFGLNGPLGIVVDVEGALYIADGNRIVKVGRLGHNYRPPVAILTGVASTYVAVDAFGNVYAAGGYGATSGVVVKSLWNGHAYSAPQTVLSGVNDLTGLAVDALGNVFVSSDDNYETPFADEAYYPAAIVDLYEAPIHLSHPFFAPHAAPTYGPAIPKGQYIYVAQGAASDALGNIYVLWIGGPRGGFSYNVARVHPHDVWYGNLAQGLSTTQQVTFWITGTEIIPPAIQVRTSGKAAADFSVTGPVTCDPDAGIPLNIDGYPVACSAPITFTPHAGGVRVSSAQLVSESPGTEGQTIANVSLVGIGQRTGAALANHP